MLNKKLLSCGLISLLLLTWCGTQDSPKVELSSIKTIESYQTTFNEMFSNYQKNQVVPNSKGKYEFLTELFLQGDQGQVTKFGDFEFPTGISTLSLKLSGDYNFENTGSIEVNGRVRGFLNKRASGQGDIDLSFKLLNNKLTYTLNSFDKQVLKLSGMSNEDQLRMLVGVQDYIGKQKVYVIDQETYQQFLQELLSNSTLKNGPLYKNTKEQEKKITKLFLDSKVVEVKAGKDLDDGSEKVSFQMNRKNLIKFLNKVSELLEQKTKYDKELKFLKNIRVLGNLTIKDKLLTDSNISTDIIVKQTNRQTQTGTYSTIQIDTKLKLPTTNIYDWDITTLLSSSQSKNKIQLHLKSKIY